MKTIAAKTSAKVKAFSVDRQLKDFALEGHHFIAFTNLKSQPVERSSDLDFLIFLALAFDEESEKAGYVQLPVRMGIYWQ